MNVFMRGSQQRPRVFAHRGASKEALENTMAAFELALIQRADGIELDVRMTRCGQVVVFHDVDLRRLGDASDRIHELTYEELKQHSVGGEIVPLLSDVFNRVGDQCLINVELKSVPKDSMRFVNETAKVITEAGLQRSVILSSFDPLLLALLRVVQKGRKLAQGLLFHSKQSPPLAKGWLSWPLQVNAVHPESILVSEERVRNWHKQNLAVHVWTVDDDETIKRLARWGVDAIITNRPKHALCVLEEMTIFSS